MIPRMVSDEERTAQSPPAVQMQELRHRFRMHLQNMTSLISLQVRRAEHPETVRALEDLRARFSVLTAMYVDLDEAGDEPIALDEFVSNLVRRVGELYDHGAPNTLTLAVAPCALSGQRAAILGQIVVELVMNVYRHAFAERSGGTIEVEFTAIDGHAMLAVVDDGPGLRPDAADAQLGFSMVTNLAKALGGTFDHESRDGFCAYVRFPIGDPHR